MTRVYVIFSIVGWAWTLLVGRFLLAKLRHQHTDASGDAPPSEPSRDL